jgi:hypothetical protein
MLGALTEDGRTRLSFLFVVDQRKELIALFEWPAVIVQYRVVHSTWHVSSRIYSPSSDTMPLIEPNILYSDYKTQSSLIFLGLSHGVCTDF